VLLFEEAWNSEFACSFQAIMEQGRVGVCGGYKAAESASDSHQAILDSVRDSIESQVGPKGPLTVVKSSSQVVAGTNWAFQVAGDNDEILHVFVHQPLPHTGRPNSLLNVKAGLSLNTAFP
jgi:cystatin-A/B